MDSERPRRPIATKRSANSGLAVRSSENSSRIRKEGGHWGEVVLTRDAVGLVIRDVRVVAGVAQDFLAAHHFALEGVLHAVHEGELGLEVGDHGRHVGQARHAREGRAALEVDEDQVELLRRVRQREGEDESAQHL